MYSFISGVEGNKQDSVERISILEKKYSISFPDILKDYYKKYDGESIRLVTLDIDGYECEIAKIVPIIAQKMSFEYIADNDKQDGYLPNSFYPIARDRGGNYYYWDAESGAVYFVLVDDYNNPFKVADSVEKLFMMMDTNSKK